MLLPEPIRHHIAADRPRRFAVAWRNTSRDRNAPVGVLDYDNEGYQFAYLANVDQVQDFRPFLGFPDFGRRYESQRLWPFFDLRVMDRRRPDYSDYLARLGLPRESSRLDVLSRSGGELKADSIYLAEEPHVRQDGHTEATFLVRGASYATRKYSSANAAMRLQAGDQLMMKLDPDNPVNRAAILLTDQSGAPIGWVPDLLLPYAHAVRTGVPSQVTVTQNNGHEAPWHLRILVRLAGFVAPDLRIFSGEGWPPRRLTPAS